MQAFRVNLRATMKQRELEIKDLEAKLNATRAKRHDKQKVSPSYLRAVLRGDKPCSIPFADEVAIVLGVALSEMLEVRVGAKNE